MAGEIRSTAGRQTGKMFTVVEYTANGNLAAKWTVTGGFLYLDAKRDKTVNGTKDGFFVPGAAKWSGVLGLEYRADKDFSVLGRLVMTEKCFIENTSSRGKIELPGYRDL